MNKLKRAREEAGLTVTQLSGRLGIAPAAYRRYERSEVFPKINVCQEICQILGTTLGKVFDEEHEPPTKVDLSYRARPGQTLYIKIEVDENGVMVLQDQDRNVKKIA